jgi:arsenical pump membrane protein
MASDSRRSWWLVRSSSLCPTRRFLCWRLARRQRRARWRSVACRRQLPPTAAARTLSAPLLLGVFVLAVGLGSAARLWGTPAQLMQTLAPWQTAGFAAGASVIVNNLPAAMLLASGVPAHPRALLIGLNLGPNLALSGSLSALLWMRVARATGAKPSAATYTRLGLVLVPCSIAAALVALILFAPHGHVI